MKNYFITLLFVMLGIQLFSQNIISGSVTDVDERPLEGVIVTIKNTTEADTTNINGEYSLKTKSGEETIIFEKIDYISQEINVNNRNIINVVLDIDDIFELTLEELMDIEVQTASKFSENISQTPATVVVLSEKDIENRGYTSLPEILNDIPGFDISASYGNIPQLAYARGNRTGSYSERTMLMIDGIEANILYAQSMNISYDFPISSIKRIEIVYGPASAIYGPNMFSGVINIITKSASDLDNEESKVFVHNGIGTNDTQYGEITYLANYEPIELMISYRRYKSNMSDITDSPGYFNKELFGNEKIWGPYAEYYTEYDNRLDDNAIIARLKIKNIEIGYNRLFTKHGNGSEYPYDKTLPTTNWKFKRDILFLRYKKEFNEKISITFLANYQASGALPDNVWAQGWNSADNWDSTRTVEFHTWKYMSNKWSLFQDFEYRPAENWIINGGVKLSSAEFQKSYEFGRSSQTIWLPGEQWTEPEILFPEPKRIDITPGNTYIDTDWGCFLQSKLSLLENKLSLVLGARYDKNKIYGEIFSPRIGATFQVLDYLSLKTSYGTGFQSPAPRNLYGSWGGLEINKDLKPDKIKAIDFGISAKFSNFGVIATLFGHKITNSILQGKNLPQKTIYGTELKMNYILIKSSTYIENALIHINYSYINAKYDNVRTDTQNGRTSDMVGDIAPHKINVIISADAFKYFHFSIRNNYVHQRPTTISNPIEKVDAFFVTNINFQIINLFNNKLRIFMNVNNIFDTEYYHPGIDAANAGENITSPSDGWYSSRLPQPGRTYICGIRMTF